MSVIPTGIIPAQGIPFEAEAYDPALLNAIIAPWRPDVRIDKVRLVESSAMATAWFRRRRAPFWTSVTPRARPRGCPPALS